MIESIVLYLVIKVLEKMDSTLPNGLTLETHYKEKEVFGINYQLLEKIR